MIDAEREFPRYVFCYDGSQIVAQTKEDYDHLQPGWGYTPNGPFQGIDLATLQWDLEYAPFAPRHRWQQTGDSPRNAKLYTPGWLIIEKRAYAQCELLPPPVTPLQEELRLREILRRIPDSAEFARSAWTGGWFFGVGRRDAYDRRYEAHDLSGIEWCVYPSQATVPTREPEAHDPEHAMAERSTAPVRRGAGRTPESGVTYPGEDFLTILTNVVDDLWVQGKGKRRPVVEKIFKHTLWARSISRSNVYKRLQLERPDITLGEFISYRRAIALSQNV